MNPLPPKRRYRQNQILPELAPVLAPISGDRRERHRLKRSGSPHKVFGAQVQQILA